MSEHLYKPGSYQVCPTLTQEALHHAHVVKAGLTSATLSPSLTLLCSVLTRKQSCLAYDDKKFAQQLWWLQGWQGLQQELIVDMLRLWQRNLGRDDRLVADTSRSVSLQICISCCELEERLIERS